MAKDLAMASDGEASPPPSASMTTTTRSDRSIFSRVLQTCVRPFRPRLVKAKEDLPAGSPKLTPTSSAKKQCTVDERNVDSIWIYDIKARKSDPSDVKSTHTESGAQTRPHRVYYFAGGGYSQVPSSQHWKFCAALAASLPNTILTLVSYPVAPNSPAPQTIPQLQKLYNTLMTQSQDAGEVVTIGGDSSGGNIALVLALEGMRQGGRAPDAVLATCPATDGSKSNPAIDRLEKIDPLMTAAFTRHVAEKWRDTWSGDDPRVSPIHDDLSLLKKHDVEVIGVTAGNDVLSADGLAFRDLCIKHATRGTWLHWEGQMHCFPLAFGYGMSEAKEAFQWIADALAAVHRRAG